ncbi:hypothetical protein [Sneathiella chinensis]|uniref:hypothetical protein n=1 Tax=Sneathiella chinensis TaxID=349750 RepID=UPI00146C8D8B|nr:hypothetical protein [Sneathiella chinensis]
MDIGCFLSFLLKFRPKSGFVKWQLQNHCLHGCLSGSVPAREMNRRPRPGLSPLPKMTFCQFTLIITVSAHTFLGKGVTPYKKQETTSLRVQHEI